MKVKSSGNKLIYLGAVIIVILLVIVIRLGLSKKKVDMASLSDEERAIFVTEKINNIEKKDLSELGERDRMEYYVSSFIKAIENENYRDAYDMLYDGFKDNYFPTYESFEEYAQKNFPKFTSVEHQNIERNGDIYVLWVRFSDSLGSKDSYIERKFVIQEKDLNDFKLSFSLDNGEEE